MQHRNQYLPFLLLILLAVAATAGLDYITWRKGGKSIFFPSRQQKIKAIPETKSLRDTVMEHLSALDIKTDSINQYRDNEGILHMMIELTPKKYVKLDTVLIKELARSQAFVTKSEKAKADKSKYYLWQVRGKGEQLLSILFLSREGKPEMEKQVIPIKAQNKVAIIIDDMGYSLQAIDEICALNSAFTIAILPFSPLAKETASIAHQNNLEVILHLPLESMNNTYDNDHTDGIIHSQMSPDQIIKSLEENLEQFPFIHGINTHMGSKITSSEALMSIILAHIKEKELFFIDSRTTPRSVAFDLAQKMGIPSAYRHVFLDNDIDEESIKRQLLKLFQKARDNGSAIGICHPTPETLRALKNNLHLMADYDAQTVVVSQIVEPTGDS